jgi:hypothetical protein
MAHRGRLNDLKTCKDLLVDTKAKTQDCKTWIAEVLKLDNEQDILQEFSTWDAPKFPVG